MPLSATKFKDLTVFIYIGHRIVFRLRAQFYIHESNLTFMIRNENLNHSFMTLLIAAGVTGTAIFRAIVLDGRAVSACSSFAT